MTTPAIDVAFATRFLERLHGAVNDHDPDAIASLCHPEVDWRDPAASEPLHGRDAVRAFHRDVMFVALPDVRVELIEGPFLAVAECALAVRLRISGTMYGPLDPPGFAPTHGRLRFETAEFSSFRDGLLARHTVVLDMLDLARQVGAVPEDGTIGAQLGVWMQHVAAFRARAFRS